MSASGTNTNSGTNASVPKKTLDGATGILANVSQGDTVNVLATGTHAMTSLPSTALTFSGTGYTSNWGLVIQGVDASGSPAIATVRAASGKMKWVELRGNYCVVKGIKFDYSPLLTASITNMRPVQMQGGVGALRIHDCEVWFTTNVGSGVALSDSTAPRFPYPVSMTGGGALRSIEVYNNVLVNAAIRADNTANRTMDYHHNVVIYDAGASNGGVSASYPPFTWGSGTSSYPRKFYHNTVIQRRYGAGAKAHPVPAVTSNGDDTNDLSVHSNLLYADCSTSSTTALSGFLLAGGSGSSNTAAVTLGYDLFAVGPNLTDDISNWTTTKGYASYQYAQNWGTQSGSTVPTNSTAITNAAFTSVFNTTGSWTWTPGDYDHTLPYDLRTQVGRTAALSGGVVGAIDDPIIVPVVPGTQDPDAVIGQNFIDSYPFYKPLIKATVETMVRVRKNRTFQHVDFRHYLKEHVHDESTHRISVLAASASATYTLGGVDKTTGVLLATNQELSVTVTFYNGTTNDTFTTDVHEVLVLDRCQVRQLDVTNTSASTATIEMVAFD